MSTEIEDDVRQSASSLVRGILGDLQHLVERQLHLTRREIAVELRQRAAAALVLSLGIGVCFLGMIESCLSVVHLLHWVVLPSRVNPAWSPLWACHVVVAAGDSTISPIGQSL